GGGYPSPRLRATCACLRTRASLIIAVRPIRRRAPVHRDGPSTEQGGASTVKIAVVGTGYVGLVQGTCLAESGNDVACVDKVAAKIEGLKQGKVPIYEPGLAELVHRNIRDGRLKFTTDLPSGIAEAEIVFIAVGTPQGSHGGADLGGVWA